jgi:hypothetical protein
MGFMALLRLVSRANSAPCLGHHEDMSFGQTSSAQTLKAQAKAREVFF